jgi:hypothetical protein
MPRGKERVQSDVSIAVFEMSFPLEINNLGR